MKNNSVWLLKSFSIVLVIISNIIFFNQILSTDELKLIMVVLERAYLLPNSASQWSGDLMATVINLFLLPLSIVFPNLIPDLTYLFLDDSSLAVSIFRMFNSFIVILIIALSRRRDEIIIFALFSVFLFSINELANFQLGIISSYLFILILTRNKVNVYGPLIIGLKTLFIYPLINLQIGRKTKYDYWFIIFFTLVCLSSLLVYPHLVTKSFLGDTYLKLTDSRGKGNDLTVFFINILAILPILLSVYASRKEKKSSTIIIQILLLLLYCKVALYARYMYPLIAWSIYIAMNHAGFKKLFVLCVVPITFANAKLSSPDYTNGREMMIKAVVHRDNAKRRATFIPDNQFFRKLLSDEDNNEWFLENFPKKD